MAMSLYFTQGHRNHPSWQDILSQGNLKKHILVCLFSPQDPCSGWSGALYHITWSSSANGLKAPWSMWSTAAERLLHSKPKESASGSSLKCCVEPSYLIWYILWQTPQKTQIQAELIIALESMCHQSPVQWVCLVPSGKSSLEESQEWRSMSSKWAPSC